MISIDGHDVAIGMTTCPREESYIEESIHALVDSGWGFPLIYNDYKKRGDWWGFTRVLSLLASAYPNAGSYLVLQDDVVPCCKANELEIGDILATCGICSLFTTSKDNGKWVKSRCGNILDMDIDEPQKRAFSCDGGIAYIVSERFARIILETAHTKWTPTSQRIGEICHDSGVEYCLTAKNYFEHIGEKSSLHPEIPHYRWDVSAAGEFRKRN